MMPSPSTQLVDHSICYAILDQPEFPRFPCIAYTKPNRSNNTQGSSCIDEYEAMIGCIQYDEPSNARGREWHLHLRKGSYNNVERLSLLPWIQRREKVAAES